ncbi:MAG: PLP-dependent aminotransferase family protein [Burkholderiales bacterium]|nr:PLP-dependent aminotransferase family protein [Burkholderiales bacterium]
MKRYEEIAEVIAADIRNGRLTPGSKLPSIRKIITQHGVSPATAFQAYYQLEQRGLVRARERSGYYVAGTAHPIPHEPARSATPRLTSKVDISELVFAVLSAAKDRNMVQFGSAFPSPRLFPLQRLAKSVTRTARFIDPWDTVASLPPGNAALRRQIELRYLALAAPQPVDEIVITTGALEALNLCLLAVAKPGDLVAIESPGFYAAGQALERLGMKAIEIPVHPSEGLDLAALADAMKRHPIKACWFMTTFQNPMGATMSEAAKRELVALLAKHDIPLIEDDVYAELYFGKHAPLPAKAFDTRGLVMHCGSFSKSLAPGYRIGWVAGGRFSERIERLKLMTTLSASVPAQVAIADYLQTGGYDKHLRKLRHALETQLTQLRTALSQHFPPDIRLSRPEGGYFLWVEFSDSFNALDLHRRAADAGISLAPGPIFSPSRQYRHCIRLNYGWPWTDAHTSAIRELGTLTC